MGNEFEVRQKYTTLNLFVFEDKDLELRVTHDYETSSIYLNATEIQEMLTFLKEKYE